jgi:hypothetical protein
LPAQHFRRRCSTGLSRPDHSLLDACRLRPRSASHGERRIAAIFAYSRRSIFPGADWSRAPRAPGRLLAAYADTVDTRKH